MSKHAGVWLRGLAAILLGRYRRLGLDLARIQAVIYYVQAVKTARKGFLAGLLLAFCLLLAGCGFVLFHVGLFLLVPWPWNAVTLMALGSLYMLIVFLVLRWLCSEKTWMSFSKADQCVESVVRRHGG